MVHLPPCRHHFCILLYCLPLAHPHTLHIILSLASAPQFVCNGLVWPDRTPHPAAFELKHLQAPLAISLALPSAAGGFQQLADAKVQLVLRNKQHFSSSAGMTLSWRLLADGQPAGGDASTAGGGSSGGSKEGGWRPLVLEQPLEAQQEAAVGLGTTWGQLAAAVPAAAAELYLEAQAQVGGSGRCWGWRCCCCFCCCRWCCRLVQQAEAYAARAWMLTHPTL